MRGKKRNVLSCTTRCSRQFLAPPCSACRESCAPCRKNTSAIPADTQWDRPSGPLSAPTVGAHQAQATASRIAARNGSNGNDGRLTGLSLKDFLRSQGAGWIEARLQG